MAADLVIRGGQLIDGTGSSRRRADVAITNGKISEIGDGLEGRRELDASGCVVTPGFIDIHSHYDAQVFWDPSLTPSSWHGVTSVVAGNCGFSLAPIHPEHHELMLATMERVEDMSPATLAAGVPWSEFVTFAEYIDAVRRHGSVLNFGVYVGHTAIRLYVMREAGYERAATDDEIDAMRREVALAMDAGAIGFATSSNPQHFGASGRPVPSRLADVAEVCALVEPLRDRQRGVVALLPAESVKHDDMYRIQAHARRPVTWTALLSFPGMDHQERLRRNDQARREGQEVWPQVSCRPLTFSETLGQPFTLNNIPAFKPLMAGSHEERAAAYRDPSWRAQAWEQMQATGRMGSGWQTMTVAETDQRPDLIGRSIVDIAAEQGCTPLDVLTDLSLAEDLATRFRTTQANGDPQAVAELIAADNVLFGLADSGAHVSQLCDACFSTDMLGNWVREKGVMSLERAVHKLTLEPAQVYGLAGERGSIAVGQAADIAVFDPDTVSPGPLRRRRDFPADGERLVADSPVGMRHVLVNGTVIREYEQPVEAAVDARPGALLS